MTVALSIGEFSKMTYLSVKALRHYHDVGLLEPAAVDPSSGYRRYGADQVGVAQAIRRFRELDMPLERIRTIVTAPDTAARDRAIVEHLAAMQDQLARTQRTVASLQALLAGPGDPHGVRYLTLPPARAIAISGTVASDDGGQWCDGALGELHDILSSSGIPAAGPGGALWPDAFFTDGEGTATAFVPVPGAVDDHELDVGRAGPLTLLATPVATMEHVGAFADLDQTYAALGTVVAERGVGADGPIRETYVSDDRCEVAWPITDAATDTAGAPA